jgi:hypothetical protein
MAGSRSDHPRPPDLDGMMFSPSLKLHGYVEVAEHRAIEDTNEQFLTIGLN